MLCPYATILSAEYGDHILIHEHDIIRKTKKIVKSDLQSFQLPVFLKTPSPAAIQTTMEENLPLWCSLHQSIGLTISTSVQLLL